MGVQAKKLRSGEMTEELVNAGNRTLMYALGIDKEDMNKPFIGVINSWNEFHPGHKHLHKLAEAVKQGEGWLRADSPSR